MHEQSLKQTQDCKCITIVKNKIKITKQEAEVMVVVEKQGPVS